MTVKINKNSLMYWFPKIKDLPIPQPTTVTYKIPKNVLKELVNENLKNLNMTRVEECAREIGYPLFCRTDQASNKHFWDRASYIEKEEDLGSHIFEIISHNLMAGFFGLPFTHLVFREYIPMDSKYTAFYGNMPVSPERRYFIKDGKVDCKHSYWIKDAIRNPSVENWEELSDQMNTQTLSEIAILLGYASEVAEQFEGYWSVDFCKAKDGRWILIDMALGEESWHPDCDYKNEELFE